MMDWVSKDKFQESQNIRARDSVMYSRLDSNDDLHYISEKCKPLSIAASNNSSTRIALRLRQIEEERAIQKRENEAEMRAIAQEKSAVQEKYRLLEEQLVQRRNRTKLNKCAINEAAVLQLLHSKSSETIRDGPPTGSNKCLRVTGKIEVDELPNQVNVSLQQNSIIDRSQLNWTQQQIICAFPKTVPKVICFVPLVSPSYEQMDHTRSKDEPFPRYSSKPNDVRKWYPELIPIEENDSRAKRVKVDSGDDTLSCVPPTFVAPDVPDPAPPPSLSDAPESVTFNWISIVLSFSRVLPSTRTFGKQTVSYGYRRMCSISSDGIVIELVLSESKTMPLKRGFDNNIYIVVFISTKPFVNKVIFGNENSKGYQMSSSVIFQTVLIMHHWLTGEQFVRNQSRSSSSSTTDRS